MIWEQDGFVLASGRKVDANNCVVGMRPGGMDPYEGHDGGIDTCPWTRAEREELANEMIRLWTEWRDEPDWDENEAAFGWPEETP